MGIRRLGWIGVALAIACSSADDEPPPIVSAGGAGGDGGGAATVASTGGFGGAGGSETSSISVVEVVDLGSAEANGAPATFTFEIDPTTTAFSLSVTSSVPGSSVVLTRLIGPNGMLSELNAFGEVLGPFQPHVASLQGMPYAVLYPNTPALTVEPGSYQASFVAAQGSVVPATLSATLFVKKAESPPTLGSFDLDIWIVENQFGFDAAAAAEDSLIQNAIGSLRNVYQNAGITIDEIAFRDVADAPHLAVIDDIEELAQLLAVPDAERNGRAAIFIVEQVDLWTQGVILGIAPGIPGVSFVDSAPHSGVVVSLLALDAGPGQLGETMAHELGHFLGLQHTTEATGTEHDPIDDTPECTNTPNGYASPQACANQDGYNFMFWTNFGGAVSQSEVSPGQRLVMNSNPSVANDGN